MEVNSVVYITIDEARNIPEEVWERMAIIRMPKTPTHHWASWTPGEPGSFESGIGGTLEDFEKELLGQFETARPAAIEIVEAEIQKSWLAYRGIRQWTPLNQLVFDTLQKMPKANLSPLGGAQKRFFELEDHK